MDSESFAGGVAIGVIVSTGVWLLAISSFVTSANTAYTKGITDCQQGTTSYTVTVGPEGVDTTYLYKP